MFRYLAARLAMRVQVLPQVKVHLMLDHLLP
jgi:hypothetical protein